MLLDIFLIIGLPFLAGLAIRARFPRFALRVQPFVKWFSLLALFGFIVAALAGNWAYFIAFLGVILVVVAIHDAVALAIGYGTAVVGGLGTRERKAMTFEVGIRNAGLGLGLVFLFFDGLGGMAIVAGWWGIWDIIAGLVLAGLWARHTRTRTGSSTGDASGRATVEAT
jgi:BASS family bile acid:Na+ symporter